MKTVKNNFVALSAVAIALVAMSFQGAKSSTVINWYEIAEQGASFGSDEIGDQITSPSQVHSSCSSEENELRCAMQLELPESYNPEGKTLTQVLNDLSASQSQVVKDLAFREE